MDRNLLYGMFVALFAVLDPIGNLPIFVDYTGSMRRGVQVATSVLISGVVFIGLTVFLLIGQGVLHFFGISLPAFQIAGGIVLLIMGLKMITGKTRSSEIKERAEKKNFRTGLFSAFDEAGAHLKDIIVPVGIPLFVGPGSLSTVVLYSAKSDGSIEMTFAMIGIILLLSIITCVILSTSMVVSRVLGIHGLEVATRILGLLIAAIGVQFFLNGLAAVTTIFDAGKLVS